MNFSSEFIILIGPYTVQFDLRYMPYYAAPQCPEYLFFSSIINKRKSRYRVAEDLSLLVNEGSINVKMPNNFSTKKFIEITEEDLMSQEEEKISQAVKTLSKLSISKQKSQDLYRQSQKASANIKNLFEERLLTDEEFQEIKDSIKIIEVYAKSVSAYKEALAEAQNAKDFLAEFLSFSEEN
jgi:hypothetical protein